jgi:hypothetical protein
MQRIGHGEFVVMNRSTGDGQPLLFTWRHTRYQVSKLENAGGIRSSNLPHGQSPRRTFRVTTTTGLRCTLSRSADQESWMMERVLNGKGA